MNSPLPIIDSFDAHLDRAAGDFVLPDIDTVWARGQRQIRVQRAGAGVGMFSLVLVLALAVANLAPNYRDASIDAATASDPAASNAAASDGGTLGPGDDRLPGPSRGDHWHSAFGISVCGEFLPPLMSTLDPVGIHSHQDGLIHIHPFFESAEGENARMQLFFDAVGVEVTETGVTFADGSAPALPEGCSVESVHMAVWASDLDKEPMDLVDGDFGNIRFLNDRQMFVLHLGPADVEIGDIARPPSADRLGQVAPLVSTAPGLEVGDSMQMPDGTIVPLGFPPNAMLRHEVETGDTVDAIAEVYNVSVEDLLAANPELELGTILLDGHVDIPMNQIGASMTGSCITVPVTTSAGPTTSAGVTELELCDAPPFTITTNR